MMMTTTGIQQAYSWHITLKYNMVPVVTEILCSHCGEYYGILGYNAI
jgi:hypothetical protein